MSTPETALRDGEAPVAALHDSQADVVSNFLYVSAAYLFSCAYRESLRAAFARHAARNPVSEHSLRYRTLIAHEASALMHAQLEEEWAASSGRLAAGCHENVTRSA
jgi:hypothetical protein